jgi:tetratricopeptide (TPR) repeat protein
MCAIRSSRTRSRLAVALLASLWLASTAPARAAEPGQPDAVARAHLQRGLELYRHGEYPASIAEFELGYARVPSPAFLLNIAQAWRRMDRLSEARDYYQRFVDRSASDDPARAQAIDIIRKLDRALAPRSSPPVAAPPAAAPSVAAPSSGVRPPAGPPPVAGSPPVAVVPPPSAPADTAPVDAPAPSPHPRRSRTPGYVGVALLALGTGAAVAGAVLAAKAATLQSEWLHPVPGTVYDPGLLARRDQTSNLSIGLLCGGGALLVVGVGLSAAFLSGRQ